MSALRAVARIARRDAWRHKGRSVLVIVMMAIPVMGLSAADVLARTMQLSPTELANREIGSADVGMQIFGGHVLQGPNGFDGYELDGHDHLAVGSRQYKNIESKALSIVGAKVVATTTELTRSVVANGRRVVAGVTLADIANPLNRGTVTILSGHAPSTPSQVAVASALASRLGIGLGDQVSISGRSWTVASIITSPRFLKLNVVYAMPGTIPTGRSDQSIFASTTHPVSWDQVRALNAIGVLATSRAVLQHPPTFVGEPVVFQQLSSDRIGVATVAIGLAILEVVLLAGATFAVGARRQRRDLALIAAAGGDARRVRQTVLASGLVLGAAGAVLGAPLGILAAHLALPHVANLADKAPGHFDVRYPEVLGTMVLGVITGLIAAVLPARAAARDDVVSALMGRRGAVQTRRRIPVIGVAMIVIGAGMAIYEARSAHFKLILTGAAICELGFVVCAPTIVGWSGRLARLLPLAPRLALRDASRQRGRTGPAVAAIMAAIAGSVAVSAYIVSQVDLQRAQYQPHARIGQAVLAFDASASAGLQSSSVDVVRSDLGATRVIPLRTAFCQIQRKRCPQVYLGGISGRFGIAVGGATTLRTLIGRDDPAATHALETGGLVQFDSGSSTPGSSIIGQGYLSGRVTRLARDTVVVGRQGAAVAAIVSPATASKLQLRTGVATYLLTTPQIPSSTQEARADDQIDYRNTNLRIERGFDPGKYPVGELVLAIAAGFVALGATAISVGLSMAESKPDLETLTAVGARPLTRRLLVANQAGTITALGAVLGVVAGLVPAYAILRADGAVPFMMPWQSILLSLIGIPLVAMLGTAAFAGSRLSVDRRVT